jgi:serine/threonine protein kinase
MFCTNCGSELPSTAKFCAACGTAADIGSGATLLGGEEETLAPSTPRRSAQLPSRATKVSSGGGLYLSSGSDPIGGGRFVPGMIVAGRYRIVALAGRGGMGEVYRADDLKLAQTVAIKFLPESLTHDASALERFHSEVRMARQVSHRNVCRVFDIGEADGTTFLTMEFVDGEDLGSLVRRIGRLSPDKAIEIARQICAGLAAAHERGVIHRDLKPANVMLDGQGKARITDFGLAGIASAIQGAEVRAGTPAYMAPEQLAGKEVTVKSDIYALGLILYEILTGKRAYEATTLPELIKLRERSAPTNPTTFIKDLDPLIERVILRCLEKDPAKRPSTALQVSAALPGGDPLAAALAAGETPSPQMVAAAGEDSGLTPKIAVPCIAALLVGMALIVVLGVKESGLERMRLDNGSEVLAQKSRETIAKLGYTNRPADSARGFSYDGDLLDYVEKNDKPHPNWDAIIAERSPVLSYWYRESPEPMRAVHFSQISLTPGIIGRDDPPSLVSGMITIRLDPEGRLLGFLAVPPEKDSSSPPPQAVDWSGAFAAAELDPSKLHPVAPIWTVPVATDSRTAWEGIWPGTQRVLHVEAGAFHGKAVYFNLMGPWTQPTRSVPPPGTTADRASSALGVFLALSLLAGGMALAYHNYAKGKGDRRGAWRLAMGVMALEILICLFRAHLVFGQEGFSVLILAMSTGFFMSALMWMLYMALEPYVRRHWPQTIISWTRLLDGRVKDPLVGRDLLSGTLLGAAWVLVFEFGYRYSLRAGSQPLFGSTEIFLGLRQTISYGLTTIVSSILGALIFFLVLVMLRVFLRNRWLAAAAFVVIFAMPKILGSTHRMTDTIAWLLIYGIAAVAVVRFGLIVLATGTFMANALLNLPYTFNFANWYALNSYLILVVFVAIGVWGFYTSLAGQKLLKQDLFD